MLSSHLRGLCLIVFWILLACGYQSCLREEGCLPSALPKETSPLNASALYTRYLYGSGLPVIYLKCNRRIVTRDVKRGGVVLNAILRR